MSLSSRVQLSDRRRSPEFVRIEQIARILAQGSGPSVDVGIGDDAAVILAGKERLVWTTDSHVERVHFSRALMSLRDAGFRSFNAAVSDVAAMGAVALAALSAVELPASLGDRELYDLVEGQAEAAKRLHCPIAGGNLARASRISVTTTALGRTKVPLLRSGAKPGDEVWLLGPVGLSAAGLACLSRPGRKLRGAAAEACVEAFRRPLARLAEGQGLVGRAHSVIDISDGLVADAGHIAERSGVGLVLSVSLVEASLPSELIGLAPKLGRSAIDFALYGGEDYALLATGPARRRPKSATAIGRVRKGTGVTLEDERGEHLPRRAGFDHFRRVSSA